MNTKAASERYQRQILELSKQAGNETCADCGGRYPRWASWNLGIFLCVNCAGVHRKMGTHISKIKSLTLDTWTKEQVEKMREGGNVKNNLKFNPDERRNRPPANVDEGERNSELERFIFDKYKGRFMDKRPPPVPSKDDPPANTLGRRRVTQGLQGVVGNGEINRSRTAPIPTSWAEAKRSVSTSPNPIKQYQASTSTSTSASSSQFARAVSAVVSTLAPPTSTAVPARSSSATLVDEKRIQNSQTSNTTATAEAPTARTSVFDDLNSLQSNGLTGLTSSTQQPPLQMQPMQNMGNPWASLGIQQQAILSPMMMGDMTPSSYFQQTAPQPPTQPSQHNFFSNVPAQARSASLGTMAFSSQMTGNFVGGDSYNSGAQMMGQQAFGQYHQQQQPGAYAFQHTGFAPSSSAPFTQQQLMQSQQYNPQFGAFANTMMPTAQQRQQGQQPQQHSPANAFNMWG